MRFLSYLLILALVVTSCSKSVSIVIYNNTSTDCSLIVGKRNYEVKAHSEFEFCPESTQLGDFVLVRSNRADAYRIEGLAIPRAFTNPKGPFENPEAKFQLESDGRIFLVYFNTQFPVRDLPNQPDGFPLHPKSIDNK